MQPSAEEQQKLARHLGHITYLASKSQIVQALREMQSASEEGLMWVEQMLPDRTYSNAEDVIHALHLPHFH